MPLYATHTQSERIAHVQGLCLPLYSGRARTVIVFPGNLHNTIQTLRMCVCVVRSSRIACHTLLSFLHLLFLSLLFLPALRHCGVCRFTVCRVNAYRCVSSSIPVESERGHFIIILAIGHTSSRTHGGPPPPPIDDFSLNLFLSLFLMLHIVHSPSVALLLSYVSTTTVARSGHQRLPLQ